MSSESTVVRCLAFLGLPRETLARISAGRTESAKVWMQCRDLHAAARQARAPWPRRQELQTATKGQFALHSQSIQMVCHAVLANVETPAEFPSWMGVTYLRPGAVSMAQANRMKTGSLGRSSSLDTGHCREAA